MIIIIIMLLIILIVIIIVMIMMFMMIMIVDSYGTRCCKCARADFCLLNSEESFLVPMALPCVVLWRPEALDCRALIPPEALELAYP